MPFVSVAPASNLRRSWTGSLELPDPFGNGAYSDAEHRFRNARRRRTIEPLRTVRRSCGGGGGRGRVDVVDQPGRPHVDRVGWDPVLLLEQTVVQELLDPQARQWSDRLFSYRCGRQHRQTRQELDSTSTTGIRRTPARLRQARLRKPSRAPLARVERLSLQQAQSGVSGRRHLFKTTRLRGGSGRRRALSVRLQTRQPQDDGRISERRRSSFSVQDHKAWKKALHLFLALDAGPTHPRRQGCARGQLAGKQYR